MTAIPSKRGRAAFWLGRDQRPAEKKKRRETKGVKTPLGGLITQVGLSFLMNAVRHLTFWFSSTLHANPPPPPSLSLPHSAQAFHDAFSDFIAWLRVTERKIQRDDPLKLEVAELKTGLTYLQVRPAEYGRVSLIPGPLLHKVISMGAMYLSSCAFHHVHFLCYICSFIAHY